MSAEHSVRQPVAVEAFDYLRRFTQEATGIDAGRQASGNGKIVDINEGKARLDLRGVTVLAMHNIFPIETRILQHPNVQKFSKDWDLPLVAWFADVIATPLALGAGGVLAASLKVDTAEAVSIMAGANTAKNAAIVLIPDVVHAIPHMLSSVGDVGKNIGRRVSPYVSRRQSTNGSS